MQTRIHINLIKSRYLIVSLLLLMVAGGCVQNTIMPNDSSQRKISAYAFLRDTSGKATNVPAVNAQIKAFDPLANTYVAQDITDNSGFAELVFEAPTMGKQYQIIGSYKGQTQVEPIYPCCKDTTVVLYFNPEPPPPLKCDDLKDDTYKLTILDENGSTQISRSEIDKYYYKSATLFVNNGAEPITLKMPSAASIAPFELVSPAAGSSVTLVTGQSITITVQLNAINNINKYAKNLLIQAECTDKSAVLTVNLAAEIVEAKCECLDLEPTIINKEDDRNTLGTPKEYKNEEVFINTKVNCVDEIISIESLSKIGEWQITKYNATVNYNKALKVDLKFTAKDTQMKPDTFLVTYKTGDKTCTTLLILKAKACVDVCPKLMITGVDLEFSNTERNYQFVTGVCSRFLFSKANTCTNEPSKKVESFTISYPIDACFDPVDIRISVEDKEQNQLSLKYFTFTNSTGFSLKSGYSFSLGVTFTAPTIEEFQNRVLSKRGNNQKTEDSTFTIYLTLSSNIPGCAAQTIKVVAIVTTAPQTSELQKISGYNQLSDVVDIQEQQVFWFNGLSEGNTSDLVRSIRGIDGKLAPYPPDQGDFYIDVYDNSATVTTDREPILKLAPSGIMKNVKFWKYMTVNEIKNTKDVVNQIRNEYQNGTFTFTNGFTSVGGNPVSADPNEKLLLKAVYVLWSNKDDSNTGIPCEIGILHIEGRYLGREVDTNIFHLSGIDFRAIYPILF
ncbi:MAG: hypothetical protein WCR42_09545 [bacterium]